MFKNLLKFGIKYDMLYNNIVVNILAIKLIPSTFSNILYSITWNAGLI